MTSTHNYSVIVSLLFFICSWLEYMALDIPGLAKEKPLIVDFDVKPGGQMLSFEKEWGDIACKLTYITQGGTKENWAMTLTADSDRSHLMCTVMRPEGQSYLMFQTFKLEIIGNFKMLEVEVLNSSGKELSAEQYKKDEKSISDNGGKFGNSLGKASVYGSMAKREL